MILAGAVTALISVLVGFVAGAVMGMKFAYKILEHEGRLRPVTPPAVASRMPGEDV